MSQNSALFLYIVGAILLVAALSLGLGAGAIGTPALPVVLSIGGGAMLVTAAILSRP